jgi:alpha-tubulin suppressor-like RCC1 family protein
MFGNGTTTNSNVPTPVTMPSGVKFVSIAVGDSHVCALGDNGRGYCWGANSFGGIGDGTTTTRTTPVLVTLPSGVTSFKSITAGRNSTCALGNNDQAYCWGYNAAGQLGDGTTTNRSTPKIVTLPSGVTSWKSVIAGPYSTGCGIGNNDRAY